MDAETMSETSDFNFLSMRPIVSTLDNGGIETRLAAQQELMEFSRIFRTTNQLKIPKHATMLCDALMQCYNATAFLLFHILQVKVKLSLCLTKYHAMKTYWGLGVELHIFFDLGTSTGLQAGRSGF
jgi:hypothetical protein